MPSRAHKVPPGRMNERPRPTNIAPIRPTRSSRDDPIDYMFDLLVDAIDLDAARQMMEDLLQGIQDAIAKDYRLVDDLSCGLDFIERKVKSVPALQPAFEEGRRSMEKHQTNIDENVEKQEVLLRMIAESRRQSSNLFRRVYGLKNGLFLSLDPTGTLRGVVVAGRDVDVPVPISFTDNLRVMADCSRRIVMSSRPLEDARKTFLAASNAVKTASSPDQRNETRLGRDGSHKALQREQRKHRIRLANQETREKEFLRNHALQFLISIGKIRETRSPSDVSSSSGIASICCRPKQDWKGRQGSLEVPNDGPLPETEQIRMLRRSRRGLLKEGQINSSEKTMYANELADFLYHHPKSTKKDFDAKRQKEFGSHPENHQNNMDNQLREFEAHYNGVRGLVEPLVRDAVLSSDWAASRSEDDRPSQAGEIKYHMEPTKVHQRARGVRKYGRDVARQQPSWVSPLAGPPTVPSSGKSIPSVQPEDGWAEGIESPAISQAERRKRVLRMEEMATHLRRQFQRDGGPVYQQSPIMPE